MCNRRSVSSALEAAFAAFDKARKKEHTHTYQNLGQGHVHGLLAVLLGVRTIKDATGGSWPYY